MSQEMQRVPHQATPSDHGGPSRVLKGSPEYDKWVKEFSIVVLAEINRMAHDLLPHARAITEAAKVVDETMVELGSTRKEWDEQVKTFLSDIRATRMTITAETAQILGPLKEIRQFFLGSTYATEMARLKEFAELCERLQKLKESGFLDSVADTMLKLAQ